MALGTWDPNADQATEATSIDPLQLDKFIAWSETNQLDQLQQLIPQQELQRHARLMQLDPQAWDVSCQERSSEELLYLIRFFCVAENLPGWEAGERSPVIALAKILRKRGHRLERELLLWIRSVNNNRFLPYGPLL